MDTGLFAEERVQSPLSRKLINSLPNALPYGGNKTRELLDQATKRASDCDPELARIVRELGQMIESRNREIEQLQEVVAMPSVKSQSNDYMAKELRERQVELESVKSQLIASTRVITSLYEEIDRCKNQIADMMKENALNKRAQRRTAVYHDRSGTSGNSSGSVSPIRASASGSGTPIGNRQSPDSSHYMQQKYNDLKLKYDAAMKIIDKMNWKLF
jgi:septal ring factor EnvC (AmiA/AmiB activator)